MSSCPSVNWRSCSGSSSREVTSSGRWPASSDRSAVRAARSAVLADRFAERIEANVATASTRVPPAVATDATVAQSVTLRSLTGAPLSVQEYIPRATRIGLVADAGQLTADLAFGV